MRFSPPAVHRLLSEIVAAPDYFVRVSEVAIQIEAAPDLAAVLILLREAVTRVGADVGAFLSFVEDEAKTFRFLLACDPQWAVEYEQRAWYADDPWFGYARLHAEPVRTTDIAIVDESQREIVQLAERFGFVSGAIFPAPASGGLSRLGMLSLGSWSLGHFDGPVFAAFKVAALPLAMGLQEWCTRDARSEFLQRTKLTEADLQLLAFERRGLATKQIAALTGMSPAAIDSRFQRILAKLGARNRRSAARRAAEYELI